MCGTSALILYWLGRNYLEAGWYLEEELPLLGDRFMALSDEVDIENGRTTSCLFSTP